MAGLQKKRVANEFGETIVTSKTQYISETRKDVLITRQQEAKMFKTLRYYNWSKSFGMKTSFLNNLANGAYGTLQLLNDLSAFTSENVARSLAARYGWVVAGRAFGKVQGRVLPQGGGPLGRFMRVKGGQFSRRILGDFMNYFTTTEMSFENVTKTQKSIIKQLDMAGGLGPTWASMALAEAISKSPDPFATQAVKIRKGNRPEDLAESTFVDGSPQSVKYLQKRTETLKSLSASGASAPEMTYIIQAMEHGVDPDDIMRKVKQKDKKIKQALEPKINERNNNLRDGGTELDKFLDRQGLLETDRDGTQNFQDTLFESLDEILGLNLSETIGSDGYQTFETLFHGTMRAGDNLGRSRLKYDGREKKISRTDLPKKLGEPDKFGRRRMEHPQELLATDYYNYREVESSNNPKANNYVASRAQIVKGLRIADTEYLHAKNPKGGFLVYAIEFFQHKGIRDIQQIEYGGPATDVKRTLKNRTDMYVYPRSMFMHEAAQSAANKIGIDAKLKFSKKTGDVVGTLKQRRTEFLKNNEKALNQRKSKDGEFAIIADQKLRNIMKQDLIRARSPRVKDVNKVDFSDITMSEKLIQRGPKPSVIDQSNYKGYSTIYVRDPNTGAIEPMRLDAKDYPAEYKNAWDRFEERMKQQLNKSGELASDSYLYRATNLSDAELREVTTLSNELGVNEFGNRRQIDPSVARRQNYNVRGGIKSVDDIVAQAVANAQEKNFPLFWEEISAAQIDIEEAAEKIFQEDLKFIDKNYKKGSTASKDARRRQIADAEFRKEKYIEEMYKKEYDRIFEEFQSSLDVDLNVTSLDDVKNPIVREEIRKITSRLESDIKGSGNRKLPFAPRTMKKKMENYVKARARGDQSLADDLFDEMTNGGRIQFRVIKQQTGLSGEFEYGINADGTINKDTVILKPFDPKSDPSVNFVDLDYQNPDGSSIYGPRMEDNTQFASIVDGVDPSSVSDIQSYRDLINRSRRNAEGLQDIAGVGGNVNRSKTNRYGDPTAEAAWKGLSDIASKAGVNPTLLEAIGRREVGKGKGGQPLTQTGRGVTNVYKQLRNEIKRQEGRSDDTGVVGGPLGPGFQSLADGAGRSSALKQPLTRLVEACARDEEALAILHFILAVEEDDNVKNAIYRIFDPNDSFGKRATGQVTKRPQNSVTKRFGGRLQIDIAEVNRIKMILRNAESASGYSGYVQAIKDTIFGI
jgi:hypothetical protein